MDVLRQRHLEVKKAEAARDSLINDLLQKVDDMQKAMERNAFVLVLIDGDGMNFLHELVKKGITGGEEASKLLRRAVFEYLRHDRDFQHDTKIVVRVYANLRELAKVYYDQDILPAPNSFGDFVDGFNKAHPLCDFIDAGNHKEAADTKLKETFNLYVHNVHCKQIIFGASADNSYASFLNSFSTDTDITSHVRILKGPPFSYEYQHLIYTGKFQYTEFTNVFRSEMIDTNYLRSGRRSQYLQENLPDTTHTPSMAWRPKKVLNTTFQSEALKQSKPPEAEAPGARDLIELEPGRSLEGERDESDETGELSHDLSPTSSTAALGELTPPQMDEVPTAQDVEAALIKFTNLLLLKNGNSLNFSDVKDMVERHLGLQPSFWGSHVRDEWFLKSKTIIKQTIEEWIESTDNFPPGNATWILRYFKSADESPSEIMRKIWKSRGGPGNSIPMPSRYKKSRQVIRKPPSTEGSRQPTSQKSSESSHRRIMNGSIFLNAEGQRIDVPTELHFDLSLAHRLRNREKHFCNLHHLVRGCPYTSQECSYDHDTIVSDEEFEGLVGLARGQRCHLDSDCRLSTCVKAHMCPNGSHCRFGDRCMFVDLHGIDTEIAEVVERESSMM